ncbi:MAG: hypothetical protein KG003_14700 [Bacteroidetes bacterium]|nr:hypothetical protein [Bacteroidota bacterium]
MRLEKILVFLMVASIFLDDYIIGYTSNEVRAQSSFDFYYYYLIFLAFLTFYAFQMKQIPFLPSWILLPLLLLFSVSLITGAIFGRVPFSMIKQIIGITFSSVAYYNLVRYEKYDIKKLFGIYLDIAFYVALFGVVEEGLRMNGFNELFTDSKRVSIGLYRVYSIMGEPYFLSVALIPALYYYLNKFIGVKAFRVRKFPFRFLIILACFLFTFSSAGFIGLGIMGLMVLYNHGFLSPTNGRFVVLLVLGMLLLPSLDTGLFSTKEMEIRFRDSYKAFGASENLSKSEVAELNSSTFALYSNFIIAQKSFSQNPLTGTGIGTHETTYNEYFGTLFGKRFLIMYGKFNAKDGNSLFIRLMSETGIFGLFLVFLFIFRFMLGRRGLKIPQSMEFVIINQGVLIVFVIRLMRTGNYIGQGFFFFFFLYYFSYILEKNTEYKTSVLPANSPAHL